MIEKGVSKMNQVDFYIEKFKKEHPKYKNKEIQAFAFGGGVSMANELAKLVIKGEKCGTTSLHQLYELENEEIPKVDDISVILDGNGNPAAIIKNTAVEVLKFKNITKHHAKIEGEGDKTLAYWRNAHIKFFTESYNGVAGVTFDEESLVVFETFKVIYE